MTVPMTSREDLLAKAQYFVDCKYVARADERQKSMGLAYVEAERQDLAREIVNFTESYVRSLPGPAQPPARPTDAELLGVLNAARIALKSRDQSSHEMKVLEGLKVAISLLENASPVSSTDQREGGK